MSPWHLWALLLALLGVWQASAVRTVTSPSTCSYKQLGGASVKELDGGGVKVRVCGEEVVLRTSSAQEDAWKAVSWWDPSSQGKQLSDHDLKILQDYLGNYHFSRPVGQLGHGLLPSNFEGFAEEENQNPLLAALGAAHRIVRRNTMTAWCVKQVLKFEVAFGNTLNKLPLTGLAKLYRGGWTSGSQLAEMQAAQTSGSTLSFPWFQSTSSDGSHSCTFMVPNNEPANCRSQCIAKGEAFPTFLNFNTCYAKNVEEWNPREHEWLLLPNLRFKITNITKIYNDPWQLWTPKEMADWLGQPQTVPSAWERNGKTTFGPWPDIAEAVTQHAIDGPTFVTWFENRSFPEPYLHGPWDESVYLYSDKRMELQYASWTRFRLPGRTERGVLGVNPIPYYYNITFEDAGPCPM